MAGKLVRQAGMELSACVVPGLGGTERTREHAVHTDEAGEIDIEDNLLEALRQVATGR